MGILINVFCFGNNGIDIQKHKFPYPFSDEINFWKRGYRGEEYLCEESKKMSLSYSTKRAAPTIGVIKALLRAMLFTKNSDYAKADVSNCSFVDDGIFVEYREGNFEDVITSQNSPVSQVFFRENSNAVKARQIMGTTPIRYLMISKASGNSPISGNYGDAIIFANIMLNNERKTDLELQNLFESFCSCYDDKGVLIPGKTEEAIQSSVVICDLFYRKNNKPDAIQRIDDLTNSEVQDIRDSLNPPVKKEEKTEKQIESAKPEKETEEPLPEETKVFLASVEKELLPYYIKPSFHDTLVRVIKETASSVNPVNSMLFYGVAGGGKSTEAKMLAYDLKRQYSFICCFPEMEIVDFLVQTIPNMPDCNPEREQEQSENFKRRLSHILTRDAIESMIVSPTDVYKDITGKTYATDNGTIDYSSIYVDCVLSAIKAAEKNYIKNLSESAQKFRMVPSELIRMIQVGGVCEIQEPTNISKPGVLVGLNSLLDSNGTVRLPDGQLLKKHKNSVIVMTTNLDYEGCRNMNQSVLSRLGIKVEFKNPSDSDIEKWILENSELKDKTIIKKMVKSFDPMKKILESNGATDGSLGVRELIAWAQMIKVIDDPITAATYTVIPGATFDPDVQATLKVELGHHFH